MINIKAIAFINQIYTNRMMHIRAPEGLMEAGSNKLEVKCIMYLQLTILSGSLKPMSCKCTWFLNHISYRIKVSSF